MIKETLNEISTNFVKLSETGVEKINKASEILIGALENDGKIMLCGNGGSAADAQHLAAELVGRYQKNRRPLGALALTTDTSTITAVSNDFCFDDIFERQIQAIGKKNDVLFAISTSGKSKNVIKAINKANELKINTIGLTGMDGGDMLNMCNVLINVPAKRPDRIQEMHIAVGQILCEIIENSLC